MFGRSIVKAVVCAGFFVDGEVIAFACWANVFARVVAGLQFAEVLQDGKRHNFARDGLVLAGKNGPGSPQPFLNASFRKPVVDALGNHG
jgi:hypothetical protein